MPASNECCGWKGWAEMAGMDAEGRPIVPAASPARPHVVVVGGGFAGLAAAKALADAPVDVTVVDRNNYHLFQPLLYQVATAALSPTEISFPIRAALRNQRNAHVLLGDVTAVDLARRAIRVGAERVPYDYLVLAPGTRHSYFAHPEWEERAPGLKTLEDALEIRRRVLLAFERAEHEPDAARRRALLTFVVVGGGPTGVELAGAIAEVACQAIHRDFRAIDTKGARTILIEAGRRVLPSFPPELSAAAEQRLRARCVDVRTETAVSAIEPGAVVAGGERIAAETVLWAAGIAAAPLTQALGAPLDGVGRIVVDAELRLHAHPEVFVVGDAAAVVDGGAKKLPGVAPAAIQMGTHAGRAIARVVRGEPVRAFVYRDRGIMAAIGRGHAVAATAGLRLSGRLAWWAWLLVHIARIIGFRNRLVVLVEWGWAYMTRQRAGRVILAPFARDAGCADPPVRGGVEPRASHRSAA